MNTFIRSATLGIAMALFSLTAGAAEHASAADATAMVKRAVAHLKAVGKEKALADISDNKGAFIDRDLYLSVYDMNGMVLAHGTNPKLIGKDVSAIKDVSGKEFIKEILSKAKANGSGNADYEWPNPLTKNIEAKTVYFEKSGDLVFSSGYYRK
ncbi:cytochrome c [Actimicrobium sp. GrIS 1.19]|uniref:cache domain-containing protein n=1 Tax=Actimicrobium sp. GrIS 1.19 TaxID=3071708 RepID=UPI002E005B32|nr:cytochrome c [Actimicrobium sp. GrIS 1.19]